MPIRRFPRAAIAITSAIAIVPLLVTGCRADPPVVANPGIGRPIMTATEVAVGINEFPLTNLRVESVERIDGAGFTIVGNLQVNRHASRPETFDPLTLFFELNDAETFEPIESVTILPWISPSSSEVDVRFETEVAPTDAPQALLTVHLGSQTASTLVDLRLD